MKISLIVRPRDDERMQWLRELVQRLRAEGHGVRVSVTFEEGDATRFARHAARRRDDLVLVAGGDGTVNEALNGIVPAHWQPRMGILPFGTANDFARGMQISEDLAEALGVALHGREFLVDVVRVNRRYFVNVSTGGFGAEATEAAPRDAKRRLGALAYVLSGARKLMEFEPQRARFRADGKVVHDGDFVFFAVGNARLTGGGTRIAPRAEIGDGRFDVVLVGDVSRMDFLSLIPDLRAGTHIQSPDVLYFRAARLEVQAPQPLHVNADGEPVHARRYVYSVHDRPLRVMIPQDQAPESGLAAGTHDPVPAEGV